MARRDLNNLPENIDFEELLHIDNNIEEIETKINDLKKEREVLDSELRMIAEKKRLLTSELNKFKRAQSDMLGYFG